VTKQQSRSSIRSMPIRLQPRPRPRFWLVITMLTLPGSFPYYLAQPSFSSIFQTKRKKKSCCSSTKRRIRNNSIVFAPGWSRTGFSENVLCRSAATAWTSLRPGLLIIISIFIILHQFGVEITAAVAALGLTGFALSLAAKDTLTNIIAGVTIAFNRPFRINDRIYNKHVGGWIDVIEIGLRSTKSLRAITVWSLFLTAPSVTKR
jgi:small-conductance mechanosensitive channel